MYACQARGALAMTTVLSVDLDPISALHSVYGLPSPGAASRGQVLREGLARFLELFDQLGVTATFFVVGEALRDCAELHPRVIQTLQEAQAKGHRVGNHSWSHRYDLAHCDRRTQARELRLAHQELIRHGLVVEGFRAPGYTHTRALLDEVAALGYRYDSSRLPSPLYFAAKLGYVAKMALSGRRSATSLRGGSSFLGSDRPRMLPQSSLWDVPISVTPRLRLPMHGALLVRSHGAAAKAVHNHARSASYLHIHFHGTDLMQGNTPAIGPELTKAMPELKIPVQERMARLRNLLEARKEAGSIEQALALPLAGDDDAKRTGMGG